VKRLEKELAQAELKVVEGQAVRRRLHNAIQVRVPGWGPAQRQLCCRSMWGRRRHLYKAKAMLAGWHVTEPLRWCCALVRRRS
jgi:hypothetical protein